MGQHSHVEIEARLWKAIEHGHTGMLAMKGADQHFQPMTAHVDREANQLWFFTYRDTDLAEAAQGGGEGHFIVQAKDLWACVDGRLSLERDRARMDKYWSPMVAAWYPEGKDDPRLTLLRLDCTDAAVWVVDGGAMKFAFEIAKANVTGERPDDVGVRKHLDLH